MGRMKDIFIDEREDIIQTRKEFGIKWYSYDGMNWYKNIINAVLANVAQANQKKAEEEEIMRKAEEEEMRHCLW